MSQNQGGRLWVNETWVTLDVFMKNLSAETNDTLLEHFYVPHDSKSTLIFLLPDEEASCFPLLND